MADLVKPGTRVELIAPPAYFGVAPETGRIVRTTRQHKPMPGAAWHIVKFDADGRTLCVHETRMRVIDNGG